MRHIFFDAICNLNLSMAKSIFVVGGNGFVGSAVCRAAVRRGWKVQSISRTGKPFRTPNGHLPAWASNVEWYAASAFDPSSYQSLLASSDAVVHTMGTLYEGGAYKKSLRGNDPLEAVAHGAKGLFDGLNGGNPLGKGAAGSYESVNRDSAVAVCKAYRAQTKDSGRTFVYVSAEDIFRPVVPAGYITSKREAERLLQELCTPQIRSVFLRPSFIYHPHFRPISSPLAAAIAGVGSVHKALGNLAPFKILANIAPKSRDADALDTPVHSVERMLSIPPIHVDHVGEAACASIEDGSVSGPVGVWDMRRLLNWRDDEHKGANVDTYVSEK